MRRFFIDQAAIHGDEALLDADESRHLTKALRLNKGDRVQLFDGAGGVYEAAILETGERARLRIVSRRAETTASAKPLIIAQAILRGGKMDELLQRYTELGVDTFIPLWTGRCQGAFDLARETERQARQQKIIKAACKQCDRVHPLHLASPASFAEFIAGLPEEKSGWRHLMFWEEEETSYLRDVSLAGAAGVVALIGPAGGWMPEEAAMARARGFQTVRLAGHIMRAETAGVAAAALCQFLLTNI
ncbi:MAG: 16S rRNA (uracil(1498)-N(3))-methyltransferase [Desulfobulbus sp.]|nr:16S rRNA (uracil(1498)-N(3))-methyltransferase [Desulfobulbus sp.]